MMNNKKYLVLIWIILSLIIIGTTTVYGYENILNCNSGSNYEDLNDGDLLSTFHSDVGKEAVFKFDQPQTITRMKLYVKEVSSSLSFVFEYLTDDGVWVPVTETGNISGYQLKEGWNSWVLDNQIDVKAFKLKLLSSPRNTGLGELELWGKAAASLTIEHEYKDELSISSGSSDLVSWKVKLEKDVARLEEAYLIYDIYDLQCGEGIRKINGYTMWQTPDNKGREHYKWYHIEEQINPNRFKDGHNLIQFGHGSELKNGFKIKNLKLKLKYDHGQIKVRKIKGSSNSSQAYGLNNLIDDERKTHWETEYIHPEDSYFIFDFGQKYIVDFLTLYQKLGYNYQAEIEYFNDDKWIKIKDFERIDLSEGLNTFEFRDKKIITDRIRFSFDNSKKYPIIGKINEIKFWGSKAEYKPEPLEVIVTAPENGQFVGPETIIKGYVKGDVRELNIDGQNIKLQDGSFQIKANLLGKKIYKNEINHNSVTGSKSPNLSLLSNNTSGGVSGYSGSGGYNGPSGRSNSGGNTPSGGQTIIIEAIDAHGTTDKVELDIYIEEPPLIEITEPDDNETFKEAIVSIKGKILGSESVTINGSGLPYSGNKFLKKVALHQGANLVEINARNNNGQCSEKIILIQDNQAPVIDFKKNYNGSVTIDKTVTIEGYLFDYSSASLMIDGENIPLNNSYFSHTVYLGNEGNNLFHVKAEDSNGNKEEFVIELKHDTTPPEPFEPIAEPAGWTPVTTPTITFSTIDKVAGIDHYEVKIDDGEYEEVESPYQLPELENGIHDIFVKAVDKMGNVREELVQVLIDISIPQSPTGFKVTTGDERIILNWDSNPEWDLEKYRLYRKPGFSIGNYIEIDTADIMKYIDYDVTNGSEYTYWVTAVDHIGHESNESELKSIKPTTGKVKEVKNIEGGSIEYDQVKVDIPEQAVEESVEKGTEEEVKVSVAVIDNDDIPETKNKVIGGKTYAFNLIDEEGKPYKKVNFKKPVTLQFSFEDKDIPEGYSKLDLYVYHYDLRYCRWIKLENSKIDPFENKIQVQTSHFSMYNVQLQENYSPDSSQYKDLGLSPYKRYFKNNDERVSPANGNLVVKSIDLSIPGRNGLDLTIGRRYDVASAEYEIMGFTKRDTDLDFTKYYQNAEVKNDVTCYDFGWGWSLTIPRIESTDTGEYVYFENGVASKLVWHMEGDGVDNAGKGYYENHEGIHYIGKKIQEKVSQPKSSSQIASVEEIWKNKEIEIIRKNGTKYFFDMDGKIKTITDRTGNNQIEFNYDDKKLVSIVDTIGRKVKFDYNSHDKIEKIIAGNRIYQYKYDSKGRLYKAIDPAGRVTKYFYTTKVISYGGKASTSQTITKEGNLEPVEESRSSSGGISTRDIPVLDKITYPTGGSTNYFYKVEGRSSTSRNTKETEFEVLEVDKEEEKIKEVTYTHEVEVRVRKVNKTKIMVTSQVKHNNGRSAKTNYHYYFEDDDPWSYVETTTILGPNGQKTKLKYDNYSEDSNDDIILNSEKERYLKDHNNQYICIDKRVFDYNVDLRAITKVALYRSGKLQLTKEYKFDDWGNKIYQYNSGSGVKKYMHYLNTSSSYDNFGLEFNRSIIPGNLVNGTSESSAYNLLAHSYLLNNSTPVHTHYKYSFNGNLLTKARWDSQNKNWIEKEMNYDEYGNITSIVSPEGYVTTMNYSEEYNHAYITKVTKKGINGGPIKNGKNTTIPNDHIITQIGYDYNTGQTKWQIDAEGYLRENKYDKLGRLVKIIYPDDDDIYNGDIGNLTPASYANRENNPVKIQYYDDENRHTTVVNSKKDLSIDDSKIANDKLEDPIFNKSRYHYDQLDRWIKLETFNLNRNGDVEIYNTEFYYDKSGRKIAVKDAEGHITYTRYDTLNRKTKIIYPDGNKDYGDYEDNPLYTSIEYHPTLNQWMIIDAEGNKTVELKDWSNNVIKVSKYFNGQELSSTAKYDQLGNQIEVIDGEGRKYQFQYDSLGRKVEEILPEDKYIEPINSDGWTDNDFEPIQYRPKIIYKYDQQGRKIEERRPNNLVLSYEYNAMDKVIREFDSLDNTTYHYYDRNGNEVKSIDPMGNVVQKMYTARGKVLAESIVNGLVCNATDISGETGENDQINYYTYDIIGKKTSVTTANGIESVSKAGPGVVKLFAKDIYEHSEKPYYKIEPDYTQNIEYDRVGRVVIESRTITNGDAADTYLTKYKYDKVGNKVEIINPKNQRLVKEYTPQYWIEKEISYGEDDKKYITSYEYDKVGNKCQVTDPSGKVTKYKYDDLYRLEKLTKPDTTTEYYFYDNVGNKIKVRNGRNNITEYEYNSQNKLSKVLDAEEGVSKYYYGPEGNLMKRELPNGVTTRYIYNRLNQPIKEIRPEGGVISYSYDRVGNLTSKVDRKGQQKRYTYRRDYSLLSIRYYDQESNLIDSDRYEYDKEGKRLVASRVSADNNIISKIETSYDQLGRVTDESRTVNGKKYDIGYKYDKVGNMTNIKYPDSDTLLEYKYNKRNQLVGITGFADGTVDNPAFDYADNGFLTDIRYNNGTNTEITQDTNSRVENIVVTSKKNNQLLNLSYAYDGNNNVSKRTDNLTGKVNQYLYDNLDRLISAKVGGTFFGQRTGDYGIAREDTYATMSLAKAEDYWVKLDYKANSIGLLLAEQAEIGKIELEPALDVLVHRIEKESLGIYYSTDNAMYTKIPANKWIFEKDDDGDIKIIFKEPVKAGAIKIHSKYDDRNMYYEYVDESEFYGDLRKMVRIYQQTDQARLEYDYDFGGNRTAKRKIVGNEEEISYEYHQDSNRLKKMTNHLTGETFYYVYDKNGNLIEKGNDFTENPDGTVTFVKNGYKEYWRYEYTVRNRLKAVYYNGELMAQFSYDVDGMRISSEGEEGSINYVFNFSGKVVYEVNLTADEKSSFIYANSRIIAKVKGIVGSEEEVIYYHHDNLGSTRAMTDDEGKLIWEQDYMPFGDDLNKPGQPVTDFKVEAEYKYTGQRQVKGIGLYYYNARFYDPEIGRFIREDSYDGELDNPQSQNIYIYVMNNPLKYVDSTGNTSEELDFDTNIDLGPSKVDLSLEYDDLEMPKLWVKLFKGVNFREFSDFTVIKVNYEAIKNNTIEFTIHINNKPYLNGKAMTVKNIIDGLADKENIICGGTGTYFFRFSNNITSFNYRAFGYIINNGKDMTPEELYSMGPKLDNVKKRFFVGYDNNGFRIGVQSEMLNGNLQWGLGGGTPIIKNNKFISSKTLTKKDGLYFQPGQLRKTWHMMMGLNNNNNNNDLYIFMNTTDIGFRDGVETDRREKAYGFIRDLGLTDVVKFDGGGSAQLWLNNGYYKQKMKRPMPNIFLIRMLTGEGRTK